MSLVVYDQQLQQHQPPSFVLIKAYHDGSETPSVDIATPINPKDVDDSQLTLGDFLRSKLSSKLSYDEEHVMRVDAGLTDVKDMMGYPLSMALQVFQGGHKTFTVTLSGSSGVAAASTTGQNPHSTALTTVAPTSKNQSSNVVATQDRGSANVDDYSYEDMEVSGYIRRNSVSVDDFVGLASQSSDGKKDYTPTKKKKAPLRRSSVDPDDFIDQWEEDVKRMKDNRRRSSVRSVDFSDDILDDILEPSKKSKTKTYRMGTPSRRRSSSSRAKSVEREFNKSMDLTDLLDSSSDKKKMKKAGNIRWNKSMNALDFSDSSYDSSSDSEDEEEDKKQKKKKSKKTKKKDDKKSKKDDKKDKKKKSKKSKKDESSDDSSSDSDDSDSDDDSDKKKKKKKSSKKNKEEEEEGDDKKKSKKKKDDKKKKKKKKKDKDSSSFLGLYRPTSSRREK